MPEIHMSRARSYCPCFSNH